MSISVDEITLKIEEIILKIKPQLDLSAEEHSEKPLTGNFFGFSDYEMVYLFLELTEAFEVKFVKEDVIDYRFNTIKGIADIISNKLKAAV